jgi:hypothetical protein
VSVTATSPPFPGRDLSTAPAERCPLCETPLQAQQNWCLHCGAAARTRLAATANWRTPVVALTMVAVLSLGILTASLVKLVGEPSGSQASTPVTTRTVIAPATSTPPATTPALAPAAPGTGTAGVGVASTTAPATLPSTTLPSTTPRSTTSSTPSNTLRSPGGVTGALGGSK